MAVINNAIPAQTTTSDTGNGLGFILGVVLLIALILALFYYGLPYLRGAGGAGTTGTGVNVPGQVDVNINKGK